MAFKVLVADDSVTIQKIVAMALENEDMEVEGIANGKEAWEKMDSFQPDLVLADLDMPGMPGFDLSKKIKSSDAHSKVKVVLLTSDFEDFDEKEFIQSDADDYISKPFKSEDILGLVKGLLSGSEPAPEEVSIDLSPEDIIDELTADEPIPVQAEEKAEEAPAVMELNPEDIEEEPSGPEALELSPEDMAEEAPAEAEEKSAPLELTADEIVEETPETPALELTADDMVEEIQEAQAMELTADDMEPEESGSDPMLLSPDELLENFPEDVPEELTEGRIIDDIPPVKAAQEGDSMVLTSDELEDFDPLAAFDETLDAPAVSSEDASQSQENTEAPQSLTSHQTVLDEVIHDIESLADPEDMMQPHNEPEVDESSPEFFIGERAASPDDMDDLDRAFRTVANLPEIEEEPEDLLENMASGSLAHANEGKPDLIRESLSFMTEKKPAEEVKDEEPVATDAPAPAKSAPGTRQENLDEVMANHALRLIENNLDKAMKKEMAGLSDTIIKTVRAVVKEVAPEVIRSVIQEEIEKIRKTPH